MKIRCQIRTRAKKGPLVPCQTRLSILRFPTDSKALSILRSTPDSASIGIGLERAFTEAPPDAGRFHQKAVRREL